MSAHTDKIYNTLLDSMSADNIFILDNGSDKEPSHANTKIQLPNNVKVSGAYRHLYDIEINLDSKYFATITTSAILLQQDYNKKIIETVGALQDQKWSAIYSNIKNVDGWIEKNIPDQIDVTTFVKNPMYAQPIFTIWKTEYIKELRNQKHGWYDLAYHHGQGATEDMRMYNITSGWNEFTTPMLSIDWYRNSTFRENKGEHTQKEYWRANKREYFSRFKEKFNMTHPQINNHLNKNNRRN